MLEEIRANIERLVALYEGQKQLNEELASRLSESRSEVESCKQQITELKRQIDNQKLSGAITGNSIDSGASRVRIDKLISEIDKCIDLLEN